ncbi:MAG: protein-glutamate O-methyltransferase CheR [Geobacteraceae bacterium]
MINYIGLPEVVIHYISAEEFEIIRAALKNLRGFNLEIYKDACIKRRIGIRIRANNCATAKEYCELLLRDESEADLLLKVLTIHVSKFFRNPPTFAKLKAEVFPYLFARNREEASPVRFWSVGCASGEEPYSLAILLKDFFAAEPSIPRVDILATDVNEGIIKVARQGIYADERLDEVPDATKLRWFSLDDGKYYLHPEVKAMVRFRHADLFDTGVFRKCDLILCRNLLIYLERSEQEKAINGFADLLGSGGILVLGKSETLPGQTRRRFQPLCPVERIYRAI